MEIPYTVTARQDTGLWNAKLGIWLFLASEVMLFGGLFSGYVFLRLGADYPWPQQVLKVLPGFINTLVLIFSSVCVVFAWASLKLRKWGQFKVWMTLTVLCALAFMGIKAYEYYGKFTHYGIRLKDGSVVEGHIHHDVIHFKATSVTVDPTTTDLKFLDYLEEDQQPQFIQVGTSAPVDLKNWIKEAAGGEANSVTFTVSPPAEFVVGPKLVAEVISSEMTLQDNTKFNGTLGKNVIEIEVDKIDLRGYKEKDKHPEGSIALQLEHGKLAAAYKEHWQKIEKKEKEGKEIEEFKKYAAKLHHHETIEVPRDQVKFYSNFGPRYNTFYAIYFTLTGLHALHVVGGALVLAFFLFFGKSLYLQNPEHLANRVEVGGLFWHFVDLVWIFLFPILYLM